MSDKKLKREIVVDDELDKLKKKMRKDDK